MNPAPVSAAEQRRNRLKLIAIFALFLVPMLVAGVMRFADIHPAASRQKGELLDPPGDMRQARLRQADGTAYGWNPVERTWRVLVPAPSQCDDACVRVARDVEKVRQLLGKDARRVHVLWLCRTTACDWPAQLARPGTLRVLAPDASARARLPRVEAGGGVPVYVLDPNGFVVLRYAPGTDLAGMRSDLSRLLKLR